MAAFDYVNIGRENRQKSEFKKSHSHATTYSFCNVQPDFVKLVSLGDTTVNFAKNQFVRCAPMVAPTFGSIDIHSYYSFVPASDLYPYYNQVLGGIPVRMPGDNSDTFIQNLPNIGTFDLCHLLLKHSYIRAFKHNDNTNGYEDYDLEGFLHLSITAQTELGLNPVGFNHLINNDLLSKRYLYSDNTTAEKLLAYNPSTADFNIYNNETGKNRRIYSFFLDAKGKNLLKFLQTIGYRVTPIATDNVKVSILPLVACAKAHFNIFQIPQYDNYYTSVIYKLYQHYTKNVALSATGYTDTTEDTTEVELIEAITDYLAEASYMFTNDFVGAQQTSQNLGTGTNALNDISYHSKYSGALDNELSPASRGFITPVDLSTLKNPSFGTQTHNFSELDDQMLKKMYYWVNRSTQVGFALRDLLVTRGYSQYVDECESTFIGHDVQTLDFESVTSLAATQDAQLGEYSGRGQSFKQGQNYTFTAPEIGYIVALSSIVPTATYFNTFNTELLGIDKFTCYSPEFDGFGYESTPKAILGQIRNFYTRNETKEIQTFGWSPRMTGFKVQQDSVTGDMARPQYLATYAPYYLNRMPTPQLVYAQPSDTSGTKFDLFADSTLNMPAAGKTWRKGFLNDNLSNFGRIFRNWITGTSLSIFSEDNAPDDNFLSYSYIEYKEFSRMLPVADTWQTEKYDSNESTISVDK